MEHLENDQCDWKDCEKTDVYHRSDDDKWFCLKHQHQYAYPELYENDKRVR